MTAALPRPRVLVSRCLLGDRVRYDGGDRRHDAVCGVLSELFEWVPVCPEVEVGLGVPRPPIQLVLRQGELLARGVEDPGLEVGEALRRHAASCAERLGDICGCIFKSRSPSCGPGDTPLFDADGQAQGVTSGLFAASLRERFPELPMISETQLDDPGGREAFVQRVFARQAKFSGNGQ